MKGVSGTQIQGTEIFSDFLKELKKDRVMANMDKKALSDKLITRLISRYFKFYRNEYKVLVTADVKLQEGAELKKIQMQAHNEYIAFKKILKNDRIAKKKEGNGELSDWRLSLTLTKFFQDPVRWNVLLNTKVNSDE